MEARHKDFWREISGHKMRFFSLVALVCIGVFVLVGLTVTGPIMRRTVANVLEEANAYDLSIHVYGGLEEEDIALIDAIEGVGAKEYFYTLNLETARQEAIYLSSMPKAMSMPMLVAGKMPKEAGEILLDMSLKGRYQLGETISFEREGEVLLGEDGPEKLKGYDFTVVGFAKSPEFLDKVNKRTPPRGDKIDGFAYVVASAFSNAKFSKVHLQFKDLKDVPVYSEDYEARNRRHEADIQAIFKDRPQARLERMLEEHREKIADAEADIQQGYHDLDEGAQKIDDGAQKIKDGEGDLRANRRKYEKGIRQGEQKVAAGKDELHAARIALKEKENALDAAQAAVTQGLETIGEGKAELAHKKAALEGALSSENPALEEESSAAALAAIREQESSLDEKERSLRAEEERLREASQQLKLAKARLEKGEAEQKAGAEALAKKKREGKRKLDEAEGKLSASRRQWRQAKKDYQKTRTDALKDLLQGEKDLEKAKDLLDILAKPKYTITPLNRETRTFIFLDYAHRVAMLSVIFPVFLFAIAMLLASTVMNRMVEEQRIFIGTYKALGYKNADIAKKYVLFGSLAALIGGVPGGLMGNFILSRVIAEAYLSSGIFDGIAVSLYPWHIVGSIAVGILATGAIALMSVRKSLKLKTATLLLPKTPAKGTRIALERIGFVWKRLSFFHKVTARNLFRDKKRMAMTIVGVMGCVALLVLGFGIRTSVDGLVEKQFDELHRYDHMIFFEERLSREEHKDFVARINADRTVKTRALVHMENLSVEDEGNLDQSVSLIATKDGDELYPLLRLKNRKSGAVLRLEDGAIITEKLAAIKGIAVGDELAFEDEDGRQLTVKVAGIAEGYAGHYLYMDRPHYEEVFGKDWKDNAYLVYTGGEDISHYKEYTSVLAISDTADYRQMINDIAGHINFIVFVILGASSLLAIVVLSTLTNINIEERRREISTIRVLGFYPKEVTRYIYRETGVLTSIGILLGFAVGKVLHLAVIRVVVPDFAMLDPALGWLNYIMPALITIAISLVLMLWFHKKLQTIDMVEALKGGE